MADHEGIVKATRESWKALSMSNVREQLELELTFTPEEYEQLQRGFIPGAMEDKWFIYWENNTLYFHRSWTGDCIFLVRVTKDQSRYRIDEAWINADPKLQPLLDDLQYEAALVQYLIERILLDKPVSFPIPESVNGTPIKSTMDKMMYKHSVVGNAQSTAQQYNELQQREHERTHLYHYDSEEEEILALFSFRELVTRLKVANMLSKIFFFTSWFKGESGGAWFRLPDEVQRQYRTLHKYTKFIKTWKKRHTLTHDILLRYMLVGLHPQVSGMRVYHGKSFSEIVEEYCQDSAHIQRKFELFEQYHKQPLSSLEEYETLFTLKELHQLTGRDLFHFVVEGKRNWQ